MKKIFSFNFFFLIFLFNSVYAEQKIVFLDMDRIVSTSNSGLSTIKQLKDLSDKNITFLIPERGSTFYLFNNAGKYK